MSKISLLPDVGAPDGSETVVVVKDGETRRAALSRLVGSVGVTVLAITGSEPNAVHTEAPAGGFIDGHLYRFVSPITNTGAWTFNDRPVIATDGSPIAPAGSIVANGDVVLRFQLEGVAFFVVSASTPRVDAAERAISALQLADAVTDARATAIESDALLTRDPWAALFRKLGRGALGKASFSNGVRTVVTPELVIGEVGCSLNLGYGASIDDAPGSQILARFRKRLPGWTVKLDRQATAGSWTSQWQAQLDAMLPTLDLLVIGPPTNDGSTNIFNCYQGYTSGDDRLAGYELAITNLFVRGQAAGTAMVAFTTPRPNGPRSLASGRFDFGQNLPLAYPASSFVAYFVTLTYDPVTQRITSNVAGLFKTFSAGLLAVLSKLLEFDPDSGAEGTLHTVVEIDPAGTWVRVDGTITKAKSVVGGLRQVGFDQETQVWPAKSKALVSRDVAGKGTLVDVSWRHEELNRVLRRVAARFGVKVIDWEALLDPLMIDQAAIDALYADDYHPARAGYLVLAPAIDALVRWIVAGGARAIDGVA